MIDLDKERKLVHKLLHKYGIPLEEHEDKFQDFAVFFYHGYNYDDTYKKSTYINIKFMNWLSQCAKQHRTKNHVMDTLSSSYDAKREDWREWMQMQNDDYTDVPQPDLSAYCDEIMSKFKPLTQEYILDNSVCARVAKEEGVSRQAVKHRIVRDMANVLKTLEDL